MKKLIYIALATAVALAGCAEDKPVEMNTEYTYDFDDSASNPHNAEYSQLVADMVDAGVPGVMMAIYTPADGLWLGAGGYSSLKTRTPMLSNDVTRVGSTVKMFTAVTVMQLAEEGKVDLDARISEYLPEDILHKIDNADKATVRQLLQHNSGIFNYIQALTFQTASINDLVKEWYPDELLDYARGKKAYFATGKDCRYSNTGYVLLGEIISRVCGRPFYEEFEERIIIPLGLNETQFASTDPIPDKLVRGYVDFFSNMKLMESTYYSGWDYHTADGGLLSNPYNLVLFMRGVFEGGLVSAGSLGEMLDWQFPKENDPAFFRMGYGLGVFRYETDNGYWYGHSGDAIGYYATMMYHPGSGSAVSWAVNGNYGKLDRYQSSKEVMQNIFDTVVN